jgi:hypothetical protein
VRGVFVPLVIRELLHTPAATPTGTPTATRTLTPTATATPTASPTSTPGYFEGPWELEPNNSYLEANGPLRSSRQYYGYPNDQKDYFSVYLSGNGQITVDLTNHTGQGVQLLLFYQSPNNRVGWSTTPPYHIEYTGLAGWYYIYIYAESGYNTITPYTLRATLSHTTVTHSGDAW